MRMRRYVKATFSYLKKHLWLPLVAMAIPAVVACLFSTPYWEVSFVGDFNFDPYVSVGKIFSIVFDYSWQYVWPIILISVLQIVGATIIMTAVSTHFRTGRLSIRRPVRLVNSAIFPMAVSVGLICIVSIVWRFVLFGLVLLCSFIGLECGFSGVATTIVIAVIAIIMFVAHVLIITPMLYWTPIMAFYGYRFRDAAATSFKLIAGKKVFRGLFTPLIGCAIIQLTVSFLSVPTAVSVIVSFFVFLITNAYVPVYIVTSFYKISGLDRRDMLPYQLSQPLDSVNGKGEGNDVV